MSVGHFLARLLAFAIRQASAKLWASATGGHHSIRAAPPPFQQISNATPL